jgi:hypothetical protein
MTLSYKIEKMLINSVVGEISDRKVEDRQKKLFKKKINKKKNQQTSKTSRISSLLGLPRQKIYISDTPWQILVLRPVLETLLNSIGTFFTKKLVSVSNF